MHDLSVGESPPRLTLARLEGQEAVQKVTKGLNLSLKDFFRKSTGYAGRNVSEH